MMTALLQWATMRVRQIELWLITGGTKVTILGYALVLLSALALQAWPGFQYAEWKLYDESLKLLRQVAHAPAATDVVIIGVDETSFRAFEEPFALWHKHLGALVDAMVVAQPAVMGMDIVLPSKSFDSVQPGIDRALQMPLLRARGQLKLVVAQTLDDDLRARPIYPGFVALIGQDNLATALVCLDEDSVVRRVMTAQCANHGQGYADSSDAAHVGLAQRMAALLGASQGGHGLIDFRTGDAFTTISMAQVLRWQAEGNTQMLREHFAGKAVLVGLVLPLEDRLRVPVALYAAEPGNTRVPGVMVHAQVLRSLLNRGYIKSVPRWLVSSFTALACLCWFGYGFRKNLVYWVLFAMLPLLGFYALWLGYAMSPAALLVTAKLAYMARQGLEAMRLSHQRSRLTQAFAGHVNPRLLQRVLASDLTTGVGELAPQRQAATVMWIHLHESHVRGDHLFLVDRDPQTALQALAPFFEAVQKAVQRSGGMVDRFQGSAVLAYFGAPLPLRHAPRAALEAALAISRSHTNWGATLVETQGGLPQLAIGISSGTVLTGQVDMKKSSPFVLLGTPVEEAAQLALQARTHGLPVRVLVSGSVAESVGHAGLTAVRQSERESLDAAPEHGRLTYALTLIEGCTT